LPRGRRENHDKSDRIASILTKLSNQLSNTNLESYHYSSLLDSRVRGFTPDVKSKFLSEESLSLQQTARRPTTKNSNLLVGSSCNWICCYPQGLRCGTIVKGSMQPAIHNTLTREKRLHCGLSPAQRNKLTAPRQAVLQ
jgi:hypothetical protein